MTRLAAAPRALFAGFAGLVVLAGPGCAKQAASTSSVNSAPAAAAARPSVAPRPSAPQGPAAPPSAPLPSPPLEPASAAATAVRFDTEVEGCLAAASEQEMAGFLPNTRAAPSGVELASDAGGVRVVHRFAHACCLKSETTAERTGGLVTLNERLSGTPCRCRCSSALRTRLELLETDEELSVRLEEGGRVREVYRGPLPEPAAARRERKLPAGLEGKPKTK